jgi:hypothetical protein
MRVGAFRAVAIWLPRAQTTVVVWKEGERRAVCRLTRDEEFEARRAMRRGDEAAVRAICYRARRIRAIGRTQAPGTGKGERTDTGTGTGDGTGNQRERRVSNSEDSGTRTEAKGGHQVHVLAPGC